MQLVPDHAAQAMLFTWRDLADEDLTVKHRFDSSEAASGEQFGNDFAITHDHYRATDIRLVFLMRVNPQSVEE